MKHFKLILLLCALMIYGKSQAQFEINELIKEDWPIEFQRSNFIKGPDGYIWFFVDGAICRYDGKHVDQYGLAKKSDKLYSNSNVFLKETNGGYAFEIRGVFYFFKNGVFTQLNEEPFEDLDFPVLQPISSDLDIFYNGKVFYFEDGKIRVDTLQGDYKFMELRMGHDGVYRSISHEKMFFLREHKLDSIELNLMPLEVDENFGMGFWSDYRCFTINENRQLYHSSFSDTIYIYENNEMELKIPVSQNNRHYIPEDIYPVIWFVDPNNYSIPMFWSNGSDYSFYHHGLMIMNDSAFTFNECKDLIPKFFHSSHEIVFVDNGNLVIVDMIDQSIHSFEGVEGLTAWQWPFGEKVDENQYLIWPESRLVSIIDSRIERVNMSSFKYPEGKEHFKHANGTIDNKGNWYGQVLNLNSIKDEKARTVKNDLNLFMTSSKDSFSLSEVPEVGYFQKFFNEGEIIVYNNLEGYLSPDFSAVTTFRLEKGDQKITTLCDKFFEIEGEIYGINGNRSKMMKANFAKGEMEETDIHLPGNRHTADVTSEFIFSYNHESETEGPGTLTFYWTKTREHKISDSLSFSCPGRIRTYKVESDKILINFPNYSDSIYVLNMSKKSLDKHILKSRIYDSQKYRAERNKGTMDEYGRLWMKSRNGITEFDFSQGIKSREFETPFTNKEIETIQIVHDSVLLVSTKKYLYAANVSKNSNSLDSKILMSLPSENYRQVVELNDGRVCIGELNWNEYIILPEDFFTAELYDQPEIHLKSLNASDRYLYGLHPSFDSLNVENLKNNFTSEQNDIHFKFTALDFRDNDLLDYRYKLEGWEEGWHYTDRPEAKFNNLPEGEYTLTFQSRYMQRFSEPFVYTFSIKPPWYRTSWAYTTYILLLVFGIWLLLKARTRQLLKKQEVLEHKIEEATEEIREQKNMVEERNQEILDSITYAKRLQTAILPPQKLVKEWLNDSFIFYKPKDIVAGDFYWMETTKRNGRSVVFYAAADCTGHGVPGAMVSVVCSNALKRAIKEFDISDPGELLDKVAELVQESFEQSEHEVKDGMDIAVCAVDLLERKVWFAGAHNSLYRITSEDTKIPEDLKVLESGNRKLVEYSANKQPVGAYEHMEPFRTIEIQLEPGDCIYLFSDGFADQFGGEKGKKYKYKPFKQLLLDIESKEMDSQKDILDTEFERWKGNLEQVDDVCIIGLRVNGHMRKLFSKREIEVMEKIKEGLRSKEIADQLNIAKSTVDSHRKRILAKTNLNSVVELMKFCEDNEVL